MSVFIAYRRSDSRDFAHTLSSRLQASGSLGEVFLDEGGGLRPGEDFVDRIAASIARADVFLVLIGASWTTARDELGRDRLKVASDVHRREIEWALKKKVPIVPVLIGEATMPLERELPQELRPLLRIHAHRIGSSTYESDLEQLIRRLQEIIERRNRELEATLDEMLEESEDAKGFISEYSLHPKAAGAEFEDMPIIGRWQIDVKSQRVPDAVLGPAGHQTLILTLAESGQFTGVAQMHRSSLKGIFGPLTSQLDGKWALRFGPKRNLVLRLEAIADGARKVVLHISIDERMGTGYFGQDSEGLSFWLKSLGGRSYAEIERSRQF